MFNLGELTWRTGKNGVFSAGIHTRARHDPASVADLYFKRFLAAAAVVFRLLLTAARCRKLEVKRDS